MCVSNEYRSSFAIHSCDTAPTPSGFAEIVSDHFPVSLHATAIVPLFLSERQYGTKRRRSSEVYIEAIAPIFPDLLASGLSTREAIGEGHEVVNYGSRAHVAFCVPSLCRRAFGPRTRDGLLAWRRFRRECSLERRTAA